MNIKEKREDIILNPHKHVHTFAGLMYCCKINGKMHAGLLETHELHVKVGPTDRCDVMSGPCSCGAWH